jgi:hypothetical protein
MMWWSHMPIIRSSCRTHTSISSILAPCRAVYATASPHASGEWYAELSLPAQRSHPQPICPRATRSRMRCHPQPISHAHHAHPVFRYAVASPANAQAGLGQLPNGVPSGWLTPGAKSAVSARSSSLHSVSPHACSADFRDPDFKCLNLYRPSLPSPPFRSFGPFSGPEYFWTTGSFRPVCEADCTAGPVRIGNGPRHQRHRQAQGLGMQRRDFETGRRPARGQYGGDSNGGEAKARGGLRRETSFLKAGEGKRDAELWRTSRGLAELWRERVGVWRQEGKRGSKKGQGGGGKGKGWRTKKSIPSRTKRTHGRPRNGESGLCSHLPTT